MLKKKKLRDLPYLITTIRNRFVDLYRRERLVVMHPLDDVTEAELASSTEAPLDEAILRAHGTTQPSWPMGAVSAAVWGCFWRSP